MIHDVLHTKKIGSCPQCQHQKIVVNSAKRGFYVVLGGVDARYLGYADVNVFLL